MKIEFHLDRILRDNNLNFSLCDIAEKIGVHRHTIAKIYNNDVKTISLNLLSGICDFLEKHGVPSEDLPHKLIGKCPEELWKAIAKSGSVVIYLGEYLEVSDGGNFRWISKRDSSVVARFTEALSTPSMIGVPVPIVHTEYVPFKWDNQKSSDLVKKPHKDSIQIAEETFNRMRKRTKSTSIFIGSQRINTLLEFFIADLFNVKPFVPCSKKIIPFYLSYRKGGHHATKSCFGGLKNPPGRKGKLESGIYYLDDNDNWELFPWIQNKQGAGVVITSWDPGSEKLEMAVFGFSGRSTSALGEHLTNSIEGQITKSDKEEIRFWPSPVKFGKKELGIYLCGYTFDGSSDDGNLEDLKIKTIYVKDISQKALKSYTR